jgi:predicted helicase
MSYIYAVLHSTIYRTKYIELLKTEFLAIPMTKNKTVFIKYAKFGKKLIDLHLLANFPKDKSINVVLGEIKGTPFNRIL